MKILEKGREQAGWSIERTCTGSGNGDGGCGARLLIEQADVYMTHSHCYDGSSDSFRTFMCAACGTETDIPSRVHVPFVPPSPTAATRKKRQAAIQVTQGKATP